MIEYRLADPSQVPSPALLFFKESIRHNLSRLLQRAHGPERLRPHCKTHKTRQIIRMMLDAGIAKHSSARRSRRRRCSHRKASPTS